MEYRPILGLWYKRKYTKMARELSLEIEEDLFEYLELFSKTSGQEIKDIAEELLQEIILSHLDWWAQVPYANRIQEILVKYGIYSKAILDDP